MSNPYQEFLEYLDVQKAMYWLDKRACGDPNNSYILKNKAWVLEDVIEEFLRRFGDRVDTEKSAREAEDTLVEIRLPPVPGHDETKG